MVVISPRGVASRTPISAFQAAADRAFRRRTRLEVRSLEQIGAHAERVQACRTEELLSCLVKEVGFVKGGPRFLLLLSVQPEGSGADHLSAILLDVERSLDAYRAGASGPAEDVENRIFELASSAPSEAVDTSDAAGLSGYFDRLLEETFRPVLERDGDYRALGRIEIESRVPRAAVHLDGRLLGFVGAGKSLIEDVAPGRRDLALKDAAALRLARTLDVSAGETVTVELAREVRPHPARDVLLYGGIGVAAAGVALAGVALARAMDDVEAACLVRQADAADACPKVGAVTFGYRREAAPTTDPDAVNPPGVLIGALGASLIVTGAAWTLEMLLFGDDEAMPWIELGVGLLAGGLVYGGAALADAL